MSTLSARRDRIGRIVNSQSEGLEFYQGRIFDDLGRLWRDYLRPQRGAILTALALTLVWSGHVFANVLIAKFLVDKVLMIRPGGQVALTPGNLAHQFVMHRMYVALIFGGWSAFVVSYFLSRKLILGVGQKLVFKFRQDLHEKLQRLHVGFFEHMETGRIMSRVMDDVEVIRNWSTDQFINIAAYTFRLLIGLPILFVIEWRLTLIICASLPIYAWAVIKIRPIIRESNIAMRRLNSGMYGLSQEKISGIAVVKAFGQEENERSTFAMRMHNYVRLAMRVITLQSGVALIAGITSAVVTGLILYIGITETRLGTLSLGGVIAFINALPQVYLQVNGLATIATTIQAVMVVIMRVFQVLDQHEDVVPGKTVLNSISGRIEFDDVTFTYPGQNDKALDSISFVIEPGKKVALMGPSGAGKTTIFQLVCRFYDPQSGSVRIDDIDLRDCDPVSIRRHAVMVQQEPAIFSGTIGENIMYGRLEARPLEVMMAAKEAELHDFIMSLPIKYETEVGQNGISLSGGQKQRLALSTALLTRPEVLLLDDTTSALDARTESRIRDTLGKVLHGRTSLIITQRIATAKDCDLILVFDRGKLVQRGTHDTLRVEEGFYRKILLQQEAG